MPQFRRLAHRAKSKANMIVKTMNSDTGTTDVTVGSHDAKTNLAQLLDRVENGATIVITRHGAPIAKLSPFEETADRSSIQRAIDNIRLIQKNHTLGAGLSVEDLINEGRSL